MAKFCKYCGTKLEEGQACTCEDAVREAAEKAAQVSPEFTAQAQPAEAEVQAQPAAEQAAQEAAAQQPVQETPVQQAAEAQPAQENAAQQQSQETAQQAYQQQNPQQTYQQEQYQQGAQQAYQQAQYQQGTQQNYQQNPYQQNPQFSQAQQQAAPFVEELKYVFHSIPAFFKDPAGTSKAMVYRNKKETGWAMFTINIAVVFVILLIIGASINSEIRNAFGAYSSYYSDIINPGKLAFTGLLLAAIYDLILAGCVTLCDKVIFKGTLDFKGSMNLVGSKVVVDSVFYVVGGILWIVSPVLTVIVIGIGVSFTTLMQVMSYKEVCVLDSSKAFYSYFLILIIDAIAVGIVYAVALASQISQYMDIIDYLM